MRAFLRFFVCGKGALAAMAEAKIPAESFYRHADALMTHWRKVCLARETARAQRREAGRAGPKPLHGTSEHRGSSGLARAMHVCFDATAFARRTDCGCGFSTAAILPSPGPWFWLPSFRAAIATREVVVSTLRCRATDKRNAACSLARRAGGGSCAVLLLLLWRVLRVVGCGCGAAMW